jgi:hypothetical protein
MIKKAEIDQASTELAVHTSDVQRDYVFGWLLCGIVAREDHGHVTQRHSLQRLVSRPVKALNLKQPVIR